MATSVPPPPTDGLFRRLRRIIGKFLEGLRTRRYDGPTEPPERVSPAGARRGDYSPEAERQEGPEEEYEIDVLGMDAEAEAEAEVAPPEVEAEDRLGAGDMIASEARWDLDYWQEPAPRYLNVLVFDEGEKDPHPGDLPLRAGSCYRLELDIGAPAKGSIVRDPDEVPATKLPQREDGHWLELGIASADLDVPSQIRHLFLPTEGAAWVCDCDPGGAHSCAPDERRRTLEFGVRTGQQPGSAHARINLYFENNVIQSLSLAADVVAADDPYPRGGIAALTDFTLSERLADIGRLAPRDASIVVNETPGGTHVIVFKGSGDDTVTLSFSDGQLATAMTEMRANLFDVHAKRTKEGRVNRLRPDNSKGPDELRDDLTRMAVAGADYWTALSNFGEHALVVAQDGDSKTIQVARVPSSVFVFPWAAVYDLPLGMPEDGYSYCPLLEEWDGSSPFVDPAVDACPHREEHHHRENVICPFGFWGFRYAIEEPASTDNAAAPLSINASTPPSMVVAKSLRLDPTETEDHLDTLAECLPGCKPQPADSRKEVGEYLAEAKLGLAYFYCHGRAATETTKACIEVGEEDRIEPRQIVTWNRVAWDDVPDHWTETRPLVFLNGCHTTDLLPQTPVNFVDTFSQVGASGVVGTEITLAQEMASEGGEVFFRLLAGTPQMGVGEALRRTRVHFLGKGNMLGLAYTAYCRAELALTPHLP
ncbi:MAG: hypothetical protein ACRDPE_17850 [Solirubrobacterales bacterium]